MEQMCMLAEAVLQRWKIPVWASQGSANVGGGMRGGAGGGGGPVAWLGLGPGSYSGGSFFLFSGRGLFLGLVCLPPWPVLSALPQPPGNIWRIRPINQV